MHKFEVKVKIDRVVTQDVIFVLKARSPKEASDLAIHACSEFPYQIPNEIADKFERANLGEVTNWTPRGCEVSYIERIP